MTELPRHVTRHVILMVRLASTTPETSPQETEEPESRKDDFEATTSQTGSGGKSCAAGVRKMTEVTALGLAIADPEVGPPIWGLFGVLVGFGMAVFWSITHRYSAYTAAVTVRRWF